MFILVSACMWSGYEQVGDYATVQPDFDGAFSILDTEDLSVDTIHGKELRMLIEKGIEVKGVTARRIRCYKHGFYEEDPNGMFVLAYQNYTDRGNFANCQLYNKSGDCKKWSTEHVTYLEYRFKISGISENTCHIIETLDGKRMTGSTREYNITF